MSNGTRNLSLWLVDALRTALLGEINGHVRRVAIRYDNERNLLIRFYLDREPTDADFESAEDVLGELDSSICNDRFSSMHYEVVFSNAPQGELDSLDFLMFSRNEII